MAAVNLGGKNNTASIHGGDSLSKPPIGASPISRIFSLQTDRHRLRMLVNSPFPSVPPFFICSLFTCLEFDTHDSGVYVPSAHSIFTQFSTFLFEPDAPARGV